VSLAHLLNVVGKALATSILIGEIHRQLIRNTCASGRCRCRLRCSVV